MTDPRITRLFARHDPRPGELALVFGYHIPSGAVLRARHAAGLYHAGMVPRLLFTGGAPHEPGAEAESIRMALVAMEAGVPASSILVEPLSNNTFQNVLFSKNLLANLGLLDSLTRVLLVSCPWHTGRVVRTMKLWFPSRVELLACPHEQECTLDSLEHCPRCRARAENEAAFLDELITTGVLSATL